MVSLSVPQPTSPVVLMAMRQEVETLLGPSGIEVSWQDHETVTRLQTYNRLVVIRLQGQCQSGSQSRSRAGRVAAESLGQTHVVDGQVLPFADIRCDSVRDFIDFELRQTRATQRDGMFGRALGRVAAHELYHVLLRTRDHGSRGIARPALNSAELVSTAFAFSPRDERRLGESGAAETDNGETANGR